MEDRQTDPERDRESKTGPGREHGTHFDDPSSGTGQTTLTYTRHSLYTARAVINGHVS